MKKPFVALVLCLAFLMVGGFLAAPKISAENQSAAHTEELSETQANVIEIIEDKEVPLAAAPQTWPLANLLLAIVSVLLSVGFLLNLFRQEESTKAKTTLKLLSVLVGILSPMFFFATENMNNVMVMTNRFTAFSATLLLVQVGCLVIIKILGQKRQSIGA